MLLPTKHTDPSLSLCPPLLCFPSSLTDREEKRPLGAPTPHGEGCSFRSFTTDCYKLHYLDSPSGIKIVLNTSREVGNLDKALWTIYSQFYCEHVVKNPLYTIGQPFECEQFVQKLNSFVATLE